MAHALLEHCCCHHKGFQSVQCRIVERKLGFLHRVLDSDSRSVSGRVVEALNHDGISSTCLVKERLELEEYGGVTITKDMLGGQSSWDRCQKEELRKLDWERLLKRCRAKALVVVAMVQERVGSCPTMVGGSVSAHSARPLT